MSYSLDLTAAWEAHQRPRASGAPTVVSLFAGAGGSSLGYSMAGFRELLAVEWDPHAADCLRRNFPGMPVHEGDVAALDPTAVGLPTGGLDVLDGSPPCQGFSLVGGRRLNDPRNQLFRHYVRLLRVWQPRALVMENVPGLTAPKMRPVFGEILAELRDAGYQITVRELVASFYGVPQRRKRIIFVGVRNDLDVAPTHPAPTSREVTFTEAVADVGDIGLRRVPSAGNLALMIHMRQGESGRDALRRAGRKPSYFSTFRLRADQPSTTIMKDSGPLYVHPTKHRLLGTRELARLCSFPDEYDWGPSSSYTQIQARLGNSVPPLLMRAIARHLRATILDGAS